MTSVGYQAWRDAVAAYDALHPPSRKRSWETITTEETVTAESSVSMAVEAGVATLLVCHRWRRVLRSVVRRLPRRRWRRAALMVQARSALDRELEASRLRVARRSVETGELSAGVVLKVKEKEALFKVPYWAQGDAALYADTVLAQRMSLRRDAVVREALEAWWLAARNSLLSGGCAMEPAQLALDKQQYVL
eukprot:2768330-Prymnesium_polylepis.1